MPMLITLRIGLPVCPFHSPDRTCSEKAAMRSSTWCTSATTSTPSTTRVVPLGMRRATWSTERFSDTLIAPRRTWRRGAARGRTARASSTSRLHGLVGHPVLRVVQVEPGGLGRQNRSPRVEVLGEELAEGAALDLPRGAWRARRRRAASSAAAVHLGTRLLLPPWPSRWRGAVQPSADLASGSGR